MCGTYIAHNNELKYKISFIISISLLIQMSI